MQNRFTPRFISGVAFRFLRRSGSRVSIHNPLRRNGCLAPSFSRNCMPPRTTRKSYRRTVSDRTMVGTATTTLLASATVSHERRRCRLACWRRFHGRQAPVDDHQFRRSQTVSESSHFPFSSSKGETTIWCHSRLPRTTSSEFAHQSRHSFLSMAGTSPALRMQPNLSRVTTMRHTADQYPIIHFASVSDSNSLTPDKRVYR